MFLSTSVLNNLMKKAYKTGLVVARTQDAQGNDWLYLAGSYWEASVNKDFIPKKTLGDAGGGTERCDSSSGGRKDWPGGVHGFPARS